MWVFVVIAALALIIVPGLLAAHVAPAVKANNRYLKLTVFSDHVRVASILYFGEIPGQRARRLMDTDKNGTLSDTEIDAFVATWTERVHQGLEFRDAKDGPVLAIDWEPSAAGIDDRDTGAGAFSIDLVGWACTTPGGMTLWLSDQLVIPDPGEIEVRPEESPGTEITSTKVAGIETSQLTFTEENKLAGGIEISWKAPSAERSSRCREQQAVNSTARRWSWLGFGAVAALLVLAFSLIAQRFARRRAQK